MKYLNKVLGLFGAWSNLCIAACLPACGLNYSDVIEWQFLYNIFTSNYIQAFQTLYTAGNLVLKSNENFVKILVILSTSFDNKKPIIVVLYCKFNHKQISMLAQLRYAQ